MGRRIERMKALIKAAWEFDPGDGVALGCFGVVVFGIGTYVFISTWMAGLPVLLALLAGYIIVPMCVAIVGGFIGMVMHL